MILIISTDKISLPGISRAAGGGVRESRAGQDGGETGLSERKGRF